MSGQSVGVPFAAQTILRLSPKRHKRSAGQTNAWWHKGHMSTGAWSVLSDHSGVSALFFSSSWRTMIDGVVQQSVFAVIYRSALHTYELLMKLTWRKLPAPRQKALITPPDGDGGSRVSSQIKGFYWMPKLAFVVLTLASNQRPRSSNGMNRRRSQLKVWEASKLPWLPKSSRKCIHGCVPWSLSASPLIHLLTEVWQIPAQKQILEAMMKIKQS